MTVLAPRLAGAVGIVMVGVALVAGRALAQDPPQPQSVQIPTTTTALEGIPTVRTDSGEGATTRHVLDKAEAATNLLRVRVVDGRYYWTSRGNRPLRLSSSGPFTYLSSEPGTYIRFTRINDAIAYVEHVDLALGSVTWWGELRIVTGGRPGR